jgi:tetratricopeptide (TPR) repeat protein
MLVYTRKALGRTAALRVREYWPALIFYALSLLSKGMYVTMPFLLLLLDWWPLRRFSAEAWRVGPRHVCARLLLEKWPWLLLSLQVSVVTFLVQQGGGAVVSTGQLSFFSRLVNALIAYARYVGKMFLPVDLTVLYPLPASWAAWQIAVAVLVLVGISVIVIMMARTRPFLAVGWAWFLGTLVPVIGLVQVGNQAMADRYTYFPFIGLFIAFVWTGAEFAACQQIRQKACAGLAALVLLACAIATNRQTAHWSGSRALFEHAVAVTQNNAQAHMILGSLSEEEHQLAEAAKQYSEAVRIQPAHPGYRTSLGVILARNGDTNAARAQLEPAMSTFLDIIRKRPDYAEGFNNIGIALSALANHQDAADAYARAVSLQPEHLGYRNNLGVALARIGDLDGAIKAHREVVRRHPTSAIGWCNLGAELVSAGQVDKAIGCLQRAVTLNPKYSEAHGNLGGALARKGDHAAAVAHYQRALTLDPQLAKTHLNLGISLAKLNRFDEAITHFRESIRLEPGNVDAQYNLGRTLFLRGQLEPALLPLEAVVNAMPANASAHFYLGQVCAGLHRPDCAITHLRTALQLRPNWPDALGALAWILATDPDARYRNGPEAVNLVEKVAATGELQQPALLDVLAAAYAESARFDEAVATAQRAGTLARQLGQAALAANVEERSRLYQARQPYRTAEPVK